MERGEVLYIKSLSLNRRPEYEWITLFINSWNMPPSFSMMHRPGIASVSGNKIILDWTTIEEVDKYHKDTLRLAVGVANTRWEEIPVFKRGKFEEEKRQKEEHRKNLNYAGKRMKFDELAL
ncbi:MAG: hypothetical protein ABIP44_02650 [Pseudoxanthomonas sp.]